MASQITCVSNHHRLDCLLIRLSRRRKKTSKLRVTGLCEGNPPVTGGFPLQRASNSEMLPFDDIIIKNNKLYCGNLPAVLSPQRDFLYISIGVFLRYSGNFMISNISDRF